MEKNVIIVGENFKEKLQDHPEIIEFFAARCFTEEDILQATNNLKSSFNEVVIQADQLAEIASKIQNPFYEVDRTYKNSVNPFERKYRNKKNRR